MKAILDDGTNLYLHQYGNYSVRQHIQLDKNQDIVVVFNNESTLYPAWLPRATGELDEEGNEIFVFDIWNGKCGWYMFDRRVVQ